MERIISATVVDQFTCYKTTTTKRPPSLTLTGACIFKQRLATIRKEMYRESGARSQEPESSEQNSVENMTFRHSVR